MAGGRCGDGWSLGFRVVALGQRKSEVESVSAEVVVVFGGVRRVRKLLLPALPRR